jgi:hypothetical protein
MPALYSTFRIRSNLASPKRYNSSSGQTKRVLSSFPARSSWLGTERNLRAGLSRLLSDGLIARLLAAPSLLLGGDRASRSPERAVSASVVALVVTFATAMAAISVASTGPGAPEPLSVWAGSQVSGQAPTSTTPATRLRIAAPGVSRAITGTPSSPGRSLALGLAAKATTEVDHVVLGHYPSYVESAARSGGRTFQVPKHIWDAMSPGEQWAANQKFLDRAIARGSEIRLATPANAAREGSYYERELQYLTSKGYQPNASGTRMTPPGG